MFISNQKVSRSSAENISSSRVLTNKERVIETALETIKNLNHSRDVRLNLQQYKPEIMQTGVVYPQDLFKFLLKSQDLERLNHHRDAGHFYYGLAPSSFFHPVEPAEASIHKQLPFTFTIDQGVSPSAALNAIDQVKTENLSLLDCATVMDFALYRGMESVLGVEKFDILFSAEGATPLTLGRTAPFNPLNVLTRKRNVDSTDKLKKGDIISVFNHGFYPYKHLNGEASSQVAMCTQTDPELWVAGFGLKKEGVTFHGGLMDSFLECFNARRIEEKMVTEELHENLLASLPDGNIPGGNRSLMTSGMFNIEMDRKDFLTRGPYVAGKMADQALSLHEARLNRLVELPAEEGKILLKRWQEELQSN